ncbi:manganese-dependent inorganic pyrophosphatase [Lachnospiraceae bacterium KM106-2]|nr:manganese-dependent inorganic pyrophosphatase [Lachnospiraceae bacterium KM106-2]
METKSNKSVYVIGHKNPDTDSICSAIAYAELKKQITNEMYKAKRCGQVSPETRFVLDRFKVAPPEFVSDVKPKVKDIDFRKVDGVSSNLSLKKAWELMRSNKIVTLPVVENNTLEGVITVGDITKAYMDVHDSSVIASASTPYRNIVETLDAELIVGNIDDKVTTGKVLIAAANPDLMETYIKKNDIVILGNRYESQLCAIEMNAQCIIVCEGAEVTKTITKLASNSHCTVIQTPYDTYTVARLINQSMPVGYFMCTKDLVTFSREDYVEAISQIMAKKRFRDFPVLDKHGNFCGMISRRNLLDAKHKKLILVDHNEKAQAVDGFEDAEVLEIIDHHKIGNMETINPIYFRNQPVGCTATIVTQLYKENNVEIQPHIAGLLCSAILSDTLVFRSPTCTPVDKEIALELGKIAGIEVESYALDMFKAGSDLLDKTPEEIFYQDFKQFSAGEVIFGVGQISAMTSDELASIKEKLVPYMDKVYSEHKMQMLFIMLTNILDESTELLVQGEGAMEAVENAFNEKGKDGSIYLPGVVSRKKQLIPALMSSLQQENN